MVLNPVVNSGIFTTVPSTGEFTGFQPSTVPVAHLDYDILAEQQIFISQRAIAWVVARQFPHVLSLVVKLQTTFNFHPDPDPLKWA